uniref:VWA domain-containing protein n=1 Tax=Strongyloides stercoralis TaxID=6248 RepID=A0A0K0EN43_STRER
MFFFDNSLYGKNSLQKQIKIVNQFVLNSPNSNDNISTVLLSQGETSYNKSFYPILTDDFGEFYITLSSIANQTPSQGNISYFFLTSEVASKSRLNENNIYTKNPIIVYFIDSYINQIENTRMIINMMENFFTTKIRVVSIIFDTMKTSAATFFTKNSDFVHLSVDSRETVQWLFSQYQKISK